MKKVILGVFLVLNFIFFGCCNQKEYSFNQIKELRATHVIKDSLIIKEIDKLIDSQKLGVGKNEFIVVKLNNQDTLKKIATLEITESMLNVEQRRFLNKKFGRNMLKGYLFKKDKIILLYGDVDAFFELEENVDSKNIFFVKKHKFEKEKIGIMYDPPIFKYEIRNGELILISAF
jgi:hypothetical protein